MTDNNMKIERIDGAKHDEALEWTEAHLSKALASSAPDENFRSFVLLLHNRDGERRGGLVAFTSWHWLVIDSLVVEDHAQGNGWGRALLDEAEHLGRSMGCTHVTAETYTSKAFYLHLGYTVSSRLLDFPPGGSFARVVKSLN